MRARFVLPCLLLLVAAPAFGQTVAVPAGHFADHTIPVPDGASVVWRFSPQPAQKAKDLPKGRVIFAGAAGTTYMVTAIVVDFDKKTVTDYEFTFQFGGTPAPPPKPIDPIPPKPDEPKPVDPAKASPWGNAPGMRVMISFQDRDLADKAKITPQQLSILTGARVRDYLNAKCTKVGGDPQYFMWDHEEDVSAMPKPWQDAHALGKGKTAWVVVGNGAKWEQFTLPATVDEFLAALKKYE